MSHSREKAIEKDRELIQAERLSAILQMVSGLAHESRNALQRAQSSLELLELGVRDLDEQQKLTDRVRAALTDLHQNYEDVKQYASPIVLSRSLTDLRQLCQTVFDEMMTSRVGTRASLHFASDKPCGEVIVDPVRMRIVFRSLFDNSLAASGVANASDGNNARIDIHCEKASLNDQPAIELHLRDHGSGLDSSIESRLFEPFVTTKQRGTGLGLAVCHRIVEAHGGEISAKNHPAGGVDVRLVLPR